MRLVRHVASMRQNRNAYAVFVSKLEGKRRFEKPRCRYKDNITTYPPEI
jgi:hypothetical protein